MNNYQEITLLSSPEIPLNFIWQKVYQQIHLALVECKEADGSNLIGISFPLYSVERKSLGNKLRLFSSKEKLSQLNIQQWLDRFTDYVHVTGIRDVPANCSYALFSRIQAKSNIERLARRRAKRKGISTQQAIEEFNGFNNEELNLPFIKLKSLSSAHDFRLFISHRISSENVNGSFNLYGLSSKATIPWF